MVESASNNGFRLIYESQGRTETRSFEQSPVLIGRSMLCDVVIESAEVSRKHAEISRDGKDWMIEDLGSRTGTFVNHARVSRQQLADGDQIMLATSGAAPVTIMFRLPMPVKTGPRQAARESDATGIVARIDLADFERTLCGPALGPGLSMPLSHVARAAAGRGEVPPLAAHAELPVVALFKQVSEILLLTENLEEMLQKVLHLAVDNSPGQRGVIYLYDEKTDAIHAMSYHEKSGRGEQPFTVSQSILHESIRLREALLVTNAEADPRFQEAVSVVELGIRAAMCVPLYHAGRVRGLVYVDSQRAAGELAHQDLAVLTVLGLMVAVGIAQMELRESVDRERSIRARLSRYHSPRVVEQIISRSGAAEGEMSAEDREVSVLFADLTGFTSLAESMPPVDVIHLLNEAFEQMASAIFQYDGTLDKYIGDAVMAVFGAPLAQHDHACRAAGAALRMQQILQDRNLAHPESRRLLMRIGINSGRAIAGDIGSPLRKDYTVIGDVVNVASRLEECVAQPGQIIIGPTTYEYVKDAFECQALPEICLRGKRNCIQPYLVLRCR